MMKNLAAICDGSRGRAIAVSATAGVETNRRQTIKTNAPLSASQGNKPVVIGSAGTAFGYPRNFLENRFVYLVISSRARGLSVGVNMNPDQFCNFDCIYCEVNRRKRGPDRPLDLIAMTAELERTLKWVDAGEAARHPRFQGVPESLLQLQHVTLSGEGEPTLCPNFADAVEAVIHLRQRGHLPWFKLVLVTNGSGLDRPEVERGLNLFSADDEIWAKLDAGTQEYMEKVNKPDCSIEEVLSRILHVARKRPVAIQSLFPAINGAVPAAAETEAYVQRLKDLNDAGAQIPLVQIHSATRPTPHSECGHLPLRVLSAIARRVREVTGLKAEVF